MGIDFKKELRKHTYRATPARISILELFEKNQLPMTAEEIHFLLKKKDMDLATIYRNLSSFEKSGIIRRVDLHKNSSFFELSATHHHHIVCTDCGLVEDFENCMMQNITAKLADDSTHFKKINEHSLEMFGLCLVCEKK